MLYRLEPATESGWRWDGLACPLGSPGANSIRFFSYLPRRTPSVSRAAADLWARGCGHRASLYSLSVQHNL